LYGYGQIGVADVMPFQWPFHETLEPWPYDPERAKALLSEAGWTDTDEDGVLDKDGRPFRFSLRTNQGNDLREDIIVIVQNDLEKMPLAAGRSTSTSIRPTSSRPQRSTGSTTTRRTRTRAPTLSCSKP
jgi:peptide/nickel transport system substrate-binding protein